MAALNRKTLRLDKPKRFGFRFFRMSNWKKTLEKLMMGQSEANIDYEDLCNLLDRFGHISRQRGSHNIFRKPGFDLINIQNSGGKAKPYQVRQVRIQLKTQTLP